MIADLELANLDLEITAIDLGVTKYLQCWELQRLILDRRIANRIGDVLLFTEHNHVYTLGKSSDEHHLLASNTELNRSGTEVYHTDRGGDITYHGPGQLVGYPIVNLADYYRDVHRYLRDIEEVLIRALRDFGVRGRRDGDFTGVWVGGDKIAAIGVKVSHWITMHGFALNVNTDLSYFERIIPCGIFHRGITSMQRLLDRIVPLEDVAHSVAHHFGIVFDRNIGWQHGEDLIKTVRQHTNESVECQS